MGFCIMTDTSANLPTPWLRQHGVEVIAFSYFIDGEEHTCPDTEAFDGKAYYNAMRDGARMTTSQINPEQYAQGMRAVLDRGEDLLFVGMSSGISGSFHMAELAAEQLTEEYPDREIRLVDSLGASLGEGRLVQKAVELRAQGASLEETAQVLLEARQAVCQIFMVDDLMHLRRTGRVSGAVAVVGTMLQIKPLLKGNERGEIVTIDKVRGRRRALEELARRYDEYVADAPSQTVGIAHADCLEDAMYLARLLMRKNPPKEIQTVVYEPVTGAHVGPGTVALFFDASGGVRSK